MFPTPEYTAQKPQPREKPQPRTTTEGYSYDEPKVKVLPNIGYSYDEPKVQLLAKCWYHAQMLAKAAKKARKV